MGDTGFQKLTPTDDVDLKEYKDSFDFIFNDDNDDIRNVAISGPYCSGKSSIIKTYEIQHPEKKFMHITLTHFKYNGNEDGSDTNSQINIADDEDVESTIETEIINQLIQQIPSKKIPDTKFKIKHETKKGRIWGLTIGITFLLLVFLYFVFHKEWVNWVSTIPVEGIKVFLNYTNGHLFQFVIVIIAAFIVLYDIHGIVRFLSNDAVFRKLRFKDAEFETESDEDEPYFDKHLDELLYLIRNSGADVIVFEDIDRFNHRVETFEALREINTLVNLCDGQKSKRNRKGIKFFYLLGDDVFISSDRTKFFDYIMPVIPVIDGSNSYNKLKDYLQGINMFDKFDDHFLRSACLYLNDLRLVKNIVNEFIIYKEMLGDIRLDYNKLLALTIYKNTFPSDYAALQNRSGYVFTLLGDDKNKLDNKEPDAMLKLAERIKKDKGSDIFEEPFKNELGEKNRFKDIQESQYYKLLKYLITYGYIDETYENYLTFFYDNVLTTRDKNFCCSVIDDVEEGYDYHLDNVQEVVKTLEPGFFKKPAILNYDLLNYLLHTGENQAELSSVVDQIKEKRNFEFVISYFNLGEEKEKFVTLLNTSWPELFSDIYNEQDDKTSLFLRSYSLYSLLISGDELLERINEGGCLTKYISSQADYLDLKLEEEYVDRLVDALQTIHVKFKVIDVSVSNAELLDRIYQLDLYEIDSENIRAFLKLKYSDLLQPSDASRVYTIIFSKLNEPLCQYLDRYPEEALNVILEMTMGEINDDEGNVISILNNTETSIDLRQKYLSLNRTMITSLTSIEETSFYMPLAERGLIKYSADNILQLYVAEKKFTEVLENFINSGSEELDYSNVKVANEKAKQFFKDAVNADGLTNERFREIVKQLDYELLRLDQHQLSLDKVIILAELDKISISSNNLTIIRNKYPDALRAYVCENPTKSIHDIGNFFMQNEIEEILSWDEVSFDDKKILLQKNLSKKISVLHYRYTEEVILTVLKERFLVDSDLPELYLKYDDYSTEIQDEIFKIANGKGSTILQSEQELSFSLLIRFIQTGSHSFSTKIAFIHSQLTYLSDEEIIEALDQSGCHELVKSLQPRVRKAVSATEENRIALELLKEAKIITEYFKDTDINKYKYVKARRKSIL